MTAIQETAAPAQATARKRSGVGRTIGMATMLPLALLGAIIAGQVLTSERALTVEHELQQIQLASDGLANRTLDAINANNLSIKSNEVLGGMRFQALDAMDRGNLQLQEVMMISDKGELLSGVARNDEPNSKVSVVRQAGEWKQAHQRAVAAATQATKNAIASGKAWRGTIDGIPLSAVPIGSEAHIVGTLDQGYVNQQVKSMLSRRLLPLLITMVLGALLANMLARPLIRRISRTGEEAALAAEGKSVQISVDGNDEITDMQDNVQRLVTSNEMLMQEIERGG